MNLIPLLELDGYFILADVIQVPDLRPRSLGFLPPRPVPEGPPPGAVLQAGDRAGAVRRSWVSRSRSSSFYTATPSGRTIFGGLIESCGTGEPDADAAVRAGALRHRPGRPGPDRPASDDLPPGPRARAAASGSGSETSWRVEAAELIDALPDLRRRSGGRPERAGRAGPAPTCSRGASPCSDRASGRTAFYVVRSGVLEVVEEDPETGKERAAPRRSLAESPSVSSAW